jgi:L-methionine (R)-S-oxide reductase
MHEVQRISYADKAQFYQELRGELRGVYNSVWLTNLANACAMIMTHLPELNWAGFYLLHGEMLCLGPFQGLPACLEIGLGRGVCGTAAQRRATLVVGDVDQFPGHIACDSRSRSEIVLPLMLGNRLLGVLDLDSPVRERFAAEDQLHLEELVQDMVSHTVWPQPLFFSVDR